LVAQRVFQPGLSPTAPSAYLRLEREWIVLDPPGQLWVDVDAFRQAVETAQATQRQTDYERAQCLYRGDLLPDDRFEDWTVEPRERLRALRLTLPMPRAWQDQPPGERELLWCPVERL
jgi:DNA-binding SARP family transcriptional activator